MSSTLSHPDLRPACLAAADEPVWGGLRVTTWLKIGIISGLFVLVFWPNLWRLWSKTNPFGGEAEWQHAIAIPFIGLYYLYANREQLLAAKVRPGWLGALIAVIGLLLFAYGIWPGQNDFVKDFGMVVTLFGVVALLAGWRVMKIAWFPIAFLVCGIPWPGLVYSWVAGPLQRLAAEVAVVVLQVTGVDAQCTGTKIIMPAIGSGAARVLNVAEACAGLKSLMTFITVAAAIAFLSARPLWQKLLIVISAIPIAIFCNVMRVAGQGLLDHYVSTQLSESFAHQFVGLVMLIPAFFLILLVGWVLDRLFVDEIEKEDAKERLVIIRKSAVATDSGRERA
ncbi:MAG TPA: exosortase/archaeosortase family protein [Tepidisphaeraceae bacterium]|nr:exosortase/archaeosortase family protein [Tepidisphaeraceae bacterium]